MAKSIDNREKLFTFYMNGEEWTVYLTDLIDENVGIWGQTRYSECAILLRRNLPDTTIRKTLVHEFTHVWLFETGRDPGPQLAFTDEDVCCMYSQMYDNLANIIEMYDCAKLLKEE